MNAQEKSSVMQSWKQVEEAKKAEAAAKAAWVANSSSQNWAAWQAAEDRCEMAKMASNVAVKQVVMRNDAMRAW